MGAEPNCLKKPFQLAPHLVNSAGGFLDGFGLRKEAPGQLIGERRSASAYHGTHTSEGSNEGSTIQKHLSPSSQPRVLLNHL